MPNAGSWSRERRSPPHSPERCVPEYRTEPDGTFDFQKRYRHRESVNHNQHSEKMTKLAFTGWAILVFNALGTGIVALRYALPQVPFPSPLPNYYVRHHWLIAHAVFASIALLAGPWQFLPAFRRRFLRAHRWLGRVYCGAVAAGWLASVPIAAHAQTGNTASAGFLLLGALWIATTAAAYFSIRRGYVQAHREWMMRSYALTAAAITLRTYLPLLLVSGIPIATAYPLVAWMCWVPNLLFAEWLLRRGRTISLKQISRHDVSGFFDSIAPRRH